MKKNIIYFVLVIAVVAGAWFVYQNNAKGVCDKKESTDSNGTLTITCVQSTCNGSCILKYRKNSENPGNWMIVPDSHTFDKRTWEYHCFCK